MAEPPGPHDPGGWVLAVDFGTTNTVAAIGDATGVRTMTIDGKTVLPSAVLLDAGRGRPDRWVVGDRAINMARRRMDCFEASPKRRIAEGSLFLGGRNVPVEQAVAAVLRVVVDEAAQQQGPNPPRTFVVTHPANWPQSRIDILTKAAREATSRRGGWPAPETLAEPVAAAQQVLDVVELSEPSRIVVLDLGGGTVDVAVVDLDRRADPTGRVSVVGRPTGIDHAGGEDFDRRLAVRMAVEAEVPELFDRLARSSDPEERERAVDIRTTARAVKEELSRHAVVPSGLPRSPPELLEYTPVQITRPQLEELIRGGPGNPPGLADAVVLAVDALQDAPAGGPAFRGVYLVGGSSRIPMLGTLVQQQTSRSPITGGDPSTAVADGAASRALRSPPDDGVRPPPDPRRLLRILVSGAIAVLTAVGVVMDIGTASGTAPPTAAGSGPPSVAAPQGGTDPTLAACPTAAGEDCESRILARSHAAWPMLPTAGCEVNGSLYGVDAYSVECRTSTTTYLVFWRPSGSLVPALTGQMQLPTAAEFVLPGAAALGDQVRGTRATPSGTRYTCVWEYRDHPVSMVLDGPNEDSTLALCGTATFLGDGALRSALGTR